ncbi:MAG: phosphatase PAP2 family protein [Luteimonas sp.]|nr:phosphatase PAP2 family protein [Luteimonas sp.]
MSYSHSGTALRRILFDRKSGPRIAGIAQSAGAGASNRPTRFLLKHGWLPLVVFAALAGALYWMGGDAWWADRLYAWEGHRWAFRSAFVTDQLIHKAGRDASAVAWICVVAAWIVAGTRPQLAQLRRPLAYLALSVLVATTLVAWFKTWSNMDCPWDLLRYGGQRPYVELLHLRPIGLTRGACFPAGHASAGYAWMALYFFFLMARPQWRWWGLAAGVGAGLLFGLSQQLRGAHFLSHDLWTAMICWATALALYLAVRAGDAARNGLDSAPLAAAQTGRSDAAWMGTR